MANKPDIQVLVVVSNTFDALWVVQALESFEEFPLNYVHHRTLSAALSHIECQDVDVILADLTLPDSQGLDTFHCLRSKSPDTPVLIFSDTPDQDLAAAAMQQGAQDFFMKDRVTKDSLYRSLRYSLERKRSQRHLAYLVNYDQLTGLANRGLFFDQFRRALARAKQSEQLLALLFVDLDHFKDINDSLGHEAGDLLLKRVADRLRMCVCEECDLISRMGGDEFALVLEDIGGLPQVTAAANRIVHALAEPFLIKQREIFTSASVGITIFPFDDNTEGALLQHADIAMYQAKRLGGNSYQYYLGGMGLQVASRSMLANDLRHGLAKEEFFLHYQPLVELDTGRIIGLESLLRWKHSTRGFISPAHFIPLAEHIGFIIRLGQWVLHRTCQDMRGLWQEGLTHIPVAINVSGRQFHNKNLVSKIQEVLGEASVTPELLELELTENVLMDDSVHQAGTLENIKKMGIKMSLDDFGTGYSSFRYLKTFPIDTLKIDRSFIQDLPHHPHNASLVVSMIDMGHRLGLSVVAEGVETEEQVRFLKDHNCDRAQGFFFARPQSLESLMPVLQNGYIPLPAMQ